MTPCAPPCPRRRGFSNVSKAMRTMSKKRNDKKRYAKALSENAELRAKYAKLKLDNQIAKLFIEEELELEAIAKRLGISERRVALALDELLND
jgi:DNA-directed RNA polymerase specialized sigma subunit